MKHLWAILALLVFAGSVGAQTSAPLMDSAAVLSVKAGTGVISLKPGETKPTVITLQIRPSWHINSNKPTLDYLIPTAVKVAPSGGVTAGPARFPAAKSLTVSFDETPLAVYEGDTPVTIPLTAAKNAKPGTSVTLKGTVSYQPCNETNCLAPAEKPFMLMVQVARPAAKPTPKPASAAQEPPPTASSPDAPAARPETPSSAAPEPVAPAPEPVTPAPVPTPEPSVPDTAQTPAAAADPVAPTVDNAVPLGAPTRAPRGLELLGFLAGMLAAGLLLNLTPCVYPMVAVTMAIFGARAETPRRQILGRAILYVLGMATMYTALGTTAALTGGLFGSALQSPAVQLFIAAFLIAMALGMFGLYTMQAPSSVTAKLGGVNRGGLLGIYLSGLVVGIFAAPCTGPVVLSLMARIGQTQDVVFGGLAFFTMALGLGIPYLILAFSTGLLKKMPRSGGWMEWVKHVFGVVLLAVAAQYIVMAVRPDLALYVTPIALILGAIYLAFLDPHGRAIPRFAPARITMGVLAIALGLYTGANALEVAKSRQAQWTIYSDARLASALDNGKPVVLDFTASWCAQCHELEARTFSDTRVRTALEPFERLRVELDGRNRNQAEALQKRYSVSGLPAIVFLDPSGEEVSAARVGGFMLPDAFLKHVERARPQVATRS